MRPSNSLSFVKSKFTRSKFVIVSFIASSFVLMLGFQNCSAPSGQSSTDSVASNVSTKDNVVRTQRSASTSFLSNSGCDQLSGVGCAGAAAQSSNSASMPSPLPYGVLVAKNNNTGQVVYSDSNGILNASPGDSVTYAWQSVGSATSVSGVFLSNKDGCARTANQPYPWITANSDLNTPPVINTLQPCSAGHSFTVSATFANSRSGMVSNPVSVKVNVSASGGTTQVSSSTISGVLIIKNNRTNQRVSSNTTNALIEANAGDSITYSWESVVGADRVIGTYLSPDVICGRLANREYPWIDMGAINRQAVTANPTGCGTATTFTIYATFINTYTGQTKKVSARLKLNQPVTPPSNLPINGMYGVLVITNNRTGQSVKSNDVNNTLDVIAGDSVSYGWDKIENADLVEGTFSSSSVVCGRAANQEFGWIEKGSVSRQGISANPTACGANADFNIFATFFNSSNGRTLKVSAKVRLTQPSGGGSGANPNINSGSSQDLIVEEGSKVTFPDGSVAYYMYRYQNTNCFDMNVMYRRVAVGSYLDTSGGISLRQGSGPQANEWFPGMVRYVPVGGFGTCPQ